MARRPKPAPDARHKCGCNFSHVYLGAFDDILTFVFKGPRMQDIEAVFDFLVADGNGIAKGYRLWEDHDPVERNGIAYWRVNASLEEPDFRFASVDDMATLIEARLGREISGRIRYFKDYAKFVNA